MFVVGTLTVVNSCISTNKLTVRNYHQLYQRTKEPTKFKASVFHSSDSSSLFIFKIYMPGLKYAIDEENNKYYANYKLFYEVYSSYQTNDLVDSATVNYQDSLYFTHDKVLTHQLKLPVQEGTKGHMAITFTDKNAERDFNRYYRINKTNDPGQQNFLVRKGNQEVHLFHYSRYFNQYKIYYREKETGLRADIFSERSFPIATPPFVTNDKNQSRVKKQKSLLLKDHTIKVEKNSKLYYVKTQNLQGPSFLFYATGEDFPRVQSSEAQTGPLRYITTHREYEQIIRASDKQAALEDYWYEVAGDMERAVNQRNIYYERVEMANLLFSSYKAGWKTDRGMIYIVMGPPDIVHFYKDSEKWLYGKAGSIEALQFLFNREDEPFAFNNYVLDRKEEYRLPWYRAVENWKK